VAVEAEVVDIFVEIGKC